MRSLGTVPHPTGRFKVGNTLSNFAFEDIDGELHLLNDILADRTLITYIKPDCDACLVELERLRNAADSPADYKRVLIISSANPLHLQELREDYGLGCLMLYDEERLFGAALKIQTFPFNLVVNRDRVILEIHGNILLPDDYQRLFSALPDDDERLFSAVSSARRMSTCTAFGAPSLASGCVVASRTLVIARRRATRQSRQMWTSAGHVPQRHSRASLRHSRADGNPRVYVT